MEAKICSIAGCIQPRASYTSKGKLVYRSYCAEHYRARRRKQERAQTGSDLPEDAPKLRAGHYVIFDLPHHKAYVVRGNKRIVQDFPKDRVNPLTIAFLKWRKLDVRIIEIQPELEMA